jgi:protease-4
MSQSDYFVERRKLKRSRALWRAGVFIVAALAVVAAGIAFGGREAIKGARSHIARIEISGTITGDKKTLDLIKRAGDRSSAKAVIVAIDSPGGTVSGSEAVYDALRRVAEKKPVIAVVEGTAASGGYIAALAAERIVARETSIVGSIGVLFQYPNVVRLLDNLGIRMEGVKSSLLKAAPNPFEPMTPESKAALEAVIGDTFEWFKRLVQQRRGFDDAALARVADGRVFSGRQSIGLALVDALGDERSAVEWLRTEKNLGKLPVQLYKRDDAAERLGLSEAAAFAADLAGFERAASALRRAGSAEREPVLDGLLALWHPAIQN